MEINLLPVLNYDGKKLDISEDVNILAENGDNFTVNSPVHFEGYVVNVGGTIELHGSSTAKLSIVCDRCTDEYEATLSFDIDERFKKDDGYGETDENSDVIMLDGSTIDLDEFLYTGIILNLPSKSLCSEDCKGLCSQCGKNLNKGTCNCENDTTDPRFDILDKLL